MTTTNSTPRSFKPITSTASGTQQTLGSVCSPRKSGPRNSSSFFHRHINTPRIAPSTMLIANPTTSRVDADDDAVDQRPTAEGDERAKKFEKGEPERAGRGEDVSRATGRS